VYIALYLYEEWIFAEQPNVNELMIGGWGLEPQSLLIVGYTP
jgi:hypothetical protein